MRIRSNHWHIVQSFGISEEFRARFIEVTTEPDLNRVPFVEPFICEDVSEAPLLTALQDAYRREGIASLIVFPLLIRGGRTGTIVFYSHRRREYREERDLAAIVAIGRIRAESFRFHLDRDVEFEQYAITKKRLPAGLGAAGARQLHFFIAEEGVTPAAHVVVSIVGGTWTVEECGDRDPSGARVGAILQALIAREPVERRPTSQRYATASRSLSWFTGMLM